MNNPIVVLHPGLETVPAGAAPAAVGTARRPVRLSSLAGKRLALLDNSKFNARELLLRMEALLRERYGIGEMRMWRKENSGLGASCLPEIVAWKPDLVLNAFGD